MFAYYSLLLIDDGAPESKLECQQIISFQAIVSQ